MVRFGYGPFWLWDETSGSAVNLKCLRSGIFHGSENYSFNRSLTLLPANFSPLLGKSFSMIT
jgi:hypothetical protein